MEVIKLRQGDSLKWLGREVLFNIDSDLDLTGWKAIFQLGPLIKVYENFEESKIIDLDITKEESENLNLGYQTAYLKFVDAEGLAGTQDVRINFLILPKEVENVAI